MADHSPSLSISAKFGSQAVGLITVLAISGSAVVLALSKQRLLCLKNYVFEPAQDSDNSELVQDLPSLTMYNSLLSAFSEAKGSNVGVSNVSSLPDGRREFDVTLADFNRTFREGSAVPDSSDPSSCKSRCPYLELSSLPSVSESVLRCPSAHAASPDTGKKERPIVKKVRFSADVVEPSGNNQEYRRRIESARMLTRNTDTRSQGSSSWQQKFEDEAANRRISTCKATSSGKLTQISGGASKGVHHQPAQDCARRKGRSQDWRVQRLAKPQLPANQMALYNGMHQSRLRALYC